MTDFQTVPEGGCPPLFQPQRQALNIWNDFDVDIEVTKIQSYFYKRSLGWVKNPCIANFQWSGASGNPLSWASKNLAGVLISFSGIATVRVDFTLTSSDGKESIRVEMEPNSIGPSKVSFVSLKGKAAGHILLNQRSQVQVNVYVPSH